MTKEQMEFSIMDRTIQSIQTEFQVISSRKLSNFSFRLKMVVPAGTHLRVPPPLSTLVKNLEKFSKPNKIPKKCQKFGLRSNWPPSADALATLRALITVHFGWRAIGKHQQSV